MNGNDFRIPNMGSIAVTGNADNRMSDIIKNINESVSMNESISEYTQDFWKKQDPYDFDETTVEDNIKAFDVAAKKLKCKSKDLLMITEDDQDSDLVFKLHETSKSKEVGKDFSFEELDGTAGVYELNGMQYITVNSYGYATVFIKKSDMNNLKKINESVSMNESIATVTCPICGAQFTYDNANSDGSHPTCPICNFQVKSQAYSNSTVESESEVNESLRTNNFIVNESVDQVLAEYFNLLESNASEAKTLLESAGLAIEVGADGLCVINEKTLSVGPKIVGGKLVKKHKTKLTPKQLKARSKMMKKNARKMAKAAHKGAAVKKRKKSMKIRRKKLGESYSLTESIMDMLYNEGITTVSRPAVSRLVNESMAYDSINESKESDQMISAVEAILANKGLEVLDSEVEVEDGVTAIEVMVQDIDADIYLGEISDEIAEMTDCEVDYDEPEADKDDPSLVDLVFYLVPRVDLLQEKKNCNEEEGCGTKKNECDGPKNESVATAGMTLNESFDAYAGGSDNVRCKLNPAFIKPGQIIYDTDNNTVFKALTEAVHSEDTISLAIDVLNSDDRSLSGLSGAEVSITPGGNYYLLKSNPLM